MFSTFISASLCLTVSNVIKLFAKEGKIEASRSWKAGIKSQSDGKRAAKRDGGGSGRGARRGAEGRPGAVGPGGPPGGGARNLSAWHLPWDAAALRVQH